MPLGLYQKETELKDLDIFSQKDKAVIRVRKKLSYAGAKDCCHLHTYDDFRYVFKKASEPKEWTFH
jgi:hypothetical protein